MYSNASSARVFVSTPFAPVLFAGLDRLGELATGMRPTPHVNDAGLFAQVIIAVIIVALDRAFVIIQKRQGYFAAAGGMIPVQHTRVVILATAKDPHVRFAGVGAAGLF